MTPPASSRDLPRRIALFILKALASLALAGATLYVGAYFALASSPGRALLRDLAGDALDRVDPRAAIGDIRWGPAPGELWAAEIALASPFGALDVRFVRAAVGVPSLAPEALEIWVGKASFTLPVPASEAPPVASAAPAGARAKNVPSLPDVRLHVEEVDLTVPGLAFHARDVVVRGALGDASAFEVATGPCHAAWLGGRRVSGWDRCEVAGRMAGRDVALTRLVLVRDGVAVVHVRGQAELPAPGAAEKGLRGRLEADLDLGPWDAAALAGDQLPLGLVVQGLVVALDGELASGSIAALHAPLVASGPFTAELVSLEVPRWEAEPGLIVPKVSLTVAGLVGAHAAALDWSVDGVSAPLMELDLEKKLVGQLPGVRIERWTFPGGATGPLATDADLAIGLSGGSVEGLVQTPDGVLFANGRLKTSPITKRSSFVATAAFDGLVGPLAALVLHDAGPAEHALLGAAPGALPGPLGGRFELAVELERASRWDPWELTLEWDATEIVAAKRIVWDGAEWIEEAEPPADDEDDGGEGDTP